MSIIVDTTNWEAGKDYPEWMNELSLATISNGYLLVKLSFSGIIKYRYR